VSTAWQQTVDELRASAITPPAFFAAPHSDEGDGMLLTDLLSPATLEWIEKKKNRYREAP